MRVRGHKLEERKAGKIAVVRVMVGQEGREGGGKERKRRRQMMERVKSRAKQGARVM